MEFEVLSQEEVEQEARRVASAFGVETFTQFSYNANITDFFSESQGIKMGWTLDARKENSTLRLLDMRRGDNTCQVALFDVLGETGEENIWEMWRYVEFHPQMARVLYRLGFEDEGVLEKLNYPLSAHEKLELRLSMPREFWPQKWLDEEAANY